MPAILIPFLIVLIIGIFNVGGDVLKDINFAMPDLRPFPTESLSRPSTQQPSTSTSTTYQPPQNTAAGFILDTEIISGPEQGSVVNDTNTVTFEFEGSIFPEDTVRITFETYIEGIDKYWKPATGTKRTVTFPSGPKEYTFQVRSKYKEVRDIVPASVTFFINTSPYFKKMDISSVSRSGSLLITLRPNLYAGEEVNITGWKLQGEIGAVEIPFGIKTVFPGGISVPSDPITVTSKDTVYLTEEKSPFGRKISFRPNICFGYLRHFYTFPLSVPSSCPDKPVERELRFFREQCQDFILHDINFSTCTVPGHASNAAVATDSECLSYIENHFTYSACFQIHKDDENFIKNQWHIYMERDFTRAKHDTIQLLDNNGLLVDTFLY